MSWKQGQEGENSKTAPGTNLTSCLWRIPGPVASSVGAEGGLGPSALGEMLFVLYSQGRDGAPSSRGSITALSVGRRRRRHAWLEQGCSGTAFFWQTGVGA